MESLKNLTQTLDMTLAPSVEAPSMAVEAARGYLKSLVNTTLQIHVSDGRMFVGMLKCTDNECNIILSQAFEYRQPSQEAVAAAAAEHQRQGKDASTFKVDMTSRFMGLIVVPGQHIIKIELQS